MVLADMDCIVANCPGILEFVQGSREDLILSRDFINFIINIAYVYTRMCRVNQYQLSSLLKLQQ